jgi:hypothetical protein
MINRKTLIGLAALTLVLFVAAGAIGEDNDVLWIVDDIVFFAFIGCAVALLVLCVGVLVRSLADTRRRSSSGA